MKKRGTAYLLRGGLVHAHLRTQVLQVLPTRIWKVIHFLASTFQENTPDALLSSKAPKSRLPAEIAPVPHFGTHFRHALQNSVMPESTAMELQQDPIQKEQSADLVIEEVAPIVEKKIALERSKQTIDFAAAALGGQKYKS